MFKILFEAIWDNIVLFISGGICLFYAGRWQAKENAESEGAAGDGKGGKPPKAGTMKIFGCALLGIGIGRCIFDFFLQ